MMDKTATLLLALSLAACTSAELSTEEEAGFIVNPALHVEVSGTVRLNGAWFPNSVYEQGELWLVPTGHGTPISLGSTRNRTYSRQVPPGTYDVVYDHQLGELVPRNEMAVILNDVVVNGPSQLDINVVATAVSGAFLVNGAPTPASVYENARISFHRAGEPEFEVGETRDQTYAVVVLPGAYQATYSVMLGSTIMPANVGAVIDERTVMLRPPVWDLDIPAVSVIADPTLDGAPFPASIYENAALSLRDEAGATIELGRTADGAAEVIVLPGVYDVLYDRLLGDLIPQNDTTAVLEDVAIDLPDPSDPDEPFALAVPVTSVELAGQFVLDGGGFPASVYENGTISLLDSLGRAILVGETRDGGYDGLRVLPGTYDVLYQRLTGGSLVPANDRHLVSTNHALGASQDLDVSIDTVQAEGTLTVGAGPAPGGAFWARRGPLASCKHCPWFRLASAGAGSYDAALIPGTYEVVYSTATDASGVSAHHVVVTSSWLVSADTTRNFVVGEVEIGDLEL